MKVSHGCLSIGATSIMNLLVYATWQMVLCLTLILLAVKVTTYVVVKKDKKTEKIQA